MARLTGCINGLHLSEGDQRAIMDELDLAACPATHNPQRRFERYPYLVRGGIWAQPEHSSARFIVRPEMSRRAACRFCTGHGSFLYPRSTCTVALETRDGEPVLARGRIVRCRCVRGRVHEVGLVFDTPVDVTLYVDTARQAPLSGGPRDAAMTDYDSCAVLDATRRLYDLALDHASVDQLRQLLVDLNRLLRDATTPRRF